MFVPLLNSPVINLVMLMIVHSPQSLPLICLIEESADSTRLKLRNYVRRL